VTCCPTKLTGRRGVGLAVIRNHRAEVNYPNLTRCYLLGPTQQPSIASVFLTRAVYRESTMSGIPPELRVQLDDRIRELIAIEVRGDVLARYELTLPTISARLAAEQEGEPELTLSSIKAFVRQIHAAELKSIEVESFNPSVERFAGCPAAVVVTRVRYNQLTEIAKFRCIWVYSGNIWFTTSLSTAWFRLQRDETDSGPTTDPMG